MKVSVIIANHKWDELFRQTIKSIYKVPYLVKVVVVNNGLELEETDKVRSWLKTKPVKLLQLQEGNPSKARNLGAMVAKGEYLVFLDNDTRVEKGWLEEVVKYLDKHPKVGGGQLKLLRMQSHMKVTNLHVEKFDSAGEMLTKNGFLVERAREAEDVGQFDKEVRIFSGKGAGMVVRRSVFEKIGGFDEDYVYYWEEPDLMWRIWKAGYEVRFLWMGTVFHAYGTKKKPVPKVPAEQQVYLACRNQVMTVLKNGVGLRCWRMFAGVGLSWLGLEILFLLTGRFKQALMIEKAWWWIISHWVRILRKRRWIKKHLKSDDGWMEQVMIRRGLAWYRGKALAYILGKAF